MSRTGARSCVDADEPLRSSPAPAAAEVADAFSEFQVFFANLRDLWDETLGCLEPPKSRFETVGKSLLRSATQLLMLGPDCLSF